MTSAKAFPARILIAEDTDDLRDLIATTLTSFGYEVVQARNGQEALSILRADEASYFLVTDFAMPKLDGLNLIHAAYEEGITLVGIVLMSGGRAPLQQEKLEEFLLLFRHKVPFTYLEKPFALNDLNNVIQKLAGRTEFQ